MKLKSPLIITPRLEAGAAIGGGFLSITYATRPGDGGRVRYCYSIDLPKGKPFVADDLQSGCGGGGLQEGLSSVLSFLGAAAEAQDYTTRTGRGSENLDLFPKRVREWASMFSDELSMLQCELEETPDLIIE